MRCGGRVVSSRAVDPAELRAPSSRCFERAPTSTPDRRAAARRRAARGARGARARGRRGARPAHFDAMQASGRACARPTPSASAREPAEVALTTWTSEGVGQGAARPGARARRRGPDRRPRAPRAARPAAAARCARRHGPHGAVRRRSPTASRRRRGSSACSHVSWVTGGRRPAAGATPGVPCCSTARRASARSRSTSRALGCAFYAGAGQKWLCGADGTGHAVHRPGRARARAPLGARLPGLGAAARARRPACSPTPAATTRRAVARGLRRGASPPHEVLGGAAGTRCTSARARWPPRSPTRLRRARPRPSRRAAHTTLVAWEDAGPAGDAATAWPRSGRRRSATCRARRTCARRRRLERRADLERLLEAL